MTQPISRRSSLAALGAAALSASAIEPVRAQTAPLHIGIIPISTNAPYYAAEKFGYFTAENITVQAEAIRGGAAAIPAMMAGSIDVVFSNSTTVAQAIAKGLDVRLILAGTIIGNTFVNDAAASTVGPDPVDAVDAVDVVVEAAALELAF